MNLLFSGSSRDAFAEAFDQTLLDPSSGKNPTKIYLLVVHMMRAEPLDESIPLENSAVQQLIKNTARANFIHLDCKAQNMMLWSGTLAFVDLDDLVFLPTVDPDLLIAAMTYQYCTRPRNDLIDLSLIAELPMESISKLEAIGEVNLNKLVYFFKKPTAVSAVYNMAKGGKIHVTALEMAYIGREGREWQEEQGGQEGQEGKASFSSMMYRSGSTLAARRSASRLR